LGDPAGIGPEILLKSIPFLVGLPAAFVVYGSKEVLDYYSRLLRIPYSIEEVESAAEVRRKGVYLVNVPVDALPAPGEISEISGKAQFSFLRKAVEEAKRGLLGAVITLPINKKAIALAGFKFPGHTEYLADAFKVKDYAMMLSNEKLKVVLLTTHVSLRKVPDFIKKENILKKLVLINRIMPGSKVAVAALNPHGGEGGLFGREEIEEIEPAVKEAQELGIKAYGPFPADTLFPKAAEGEFDVVLAMYHDQGLIPIKLLGFGRSVNVTLGLPVIRTSVDHGTAYDIAGRGIADTGSFKEAVKLALSLANFHPSSTSRT